VKLTFDNSRERALLARRVGLDADCDDTTLAAFITAELKPNRAERNRVKERAIRAAAQRERKRRGYNDADDRVVELDPTGSYPTAWLDPAANIHQAGRITFGHDLMAASAQPARRGRVGHQRASRIVREP
jgi:hypothetical protein